MSGGKEKISIEKDKEPTNSLFQRRFFGCKQISMKHVLDNLEAVSSGTSEEDVDDVPKLVTLYLLGCLFVPTKSSTIVFGYLKYIDNIKKMKNSDWSRHVFDKLQLSLCRYEFPEDVTGCAMALPYWVMNNFNIADPMDKDAELLCQKWDLQDLTKATKFNTIEEICLSKKKQVKGSKKRLGGSGQTKNSATVLGCNRKRTAVYQSTEKFRSYKKISKAVDGSSDRFKAWSPKVTESTIELYQSKAHYSAATNKAQTTPNSNGWLIEEESDSGVDLNAVEKSPIGLSSPIGSELGEKAEEKKSLLNNVEDDESLVLDYMLLSDNEHSNSPTSVVNQTQLVTDFENFEIVVNNSIVDPELPSEIRKKYFDLCSDRKSILHSRFLKSVGPQLAAGIISDTIKITEWIKESKIKTCDNLETWDQTLRGFEVLGMDVAFIRAKIKKLLKLFLESEKAMDKKRFEEANVESRRIEDEMKGLELKMAELKNAKRRLTNEMDDVKGIAKKYNDLFKEEANAPWDC